jgi:hypothetical protein
VSAAGGTELVDHRDGEGVEHGGRRKLDNEPVRKRVPTRNADALRPQAAVDGPANGLVGRGGLQADRKSAGCPGEEIGRAAV